MGAARGLQLVVNNDKAVQFDLSSNGNKNMYNTDGGNFLHVVGQVF